MDRAFGFIDLTLRDAHQCLWSTRMTTDQMAPIVDTLDRVGFDYVNVLGGAVFDVQVRYLRESPWERLALLCQRFSTPVDALTRGQSLYTFELFPDDVVELNSQVLARLGVRVLTVYDALNDNRNIASSLASGHAAGMRVNAMMTYTVSPVHTDAYYVERARELVALRADFISVKDPTGLLTPERGRTLFPALVAAAGGLPLQLHSHCQTGLAPAVYAEAIRAGFRYGYTACEPLANGASLPATEEVEAEARAQGVSTRIDRAALAQCSDYFSWICERDDLPRGRRASLDPALYRHQVPGGMISNLKSQLATLGIADRLPAILDEAARVREDLGWAILVSPFAQYIITQAVLNVVQGERYRTIPDEVRKYALGYYGRPAGPIAAEFLERARVKPGERVTARPAELVPPRLARLRAELGPGARDEDVLLHAFYDRGLVAAIERRAAPPEWRTTPMIELVKWLASRRDIGRMQVEFAGTRLSIAS